MQFCVPRRHPGVADKVRRYLCNMRLYFGLAENILALKDYSRVYGSGFERQRDGRSRMATPYR